MKLYTRVLVTLAVGLTAACGLSDSEAELEQRESPAGTLESAAKLMLSATGNVFIGEFWICLSGDGSCVWTWTPDADECPSYQIDADLSGVAIPQSDSGGWVYDVPFESWGCTYPQFEPIDVQSLFTTGRDLVLTIRIDGQAVSFPIDDWKPEPLRVPNNRLTRGSEVLVPVEPAVPSNVLLRGYEFVYDDPALMEVWYHAQYPDLGGTGWDANLPSRLNPTSPAGFLVTVPDTMPDGIGTLGVSQVIFTTSRQCPFASCDLGLTRWYQVPDVKVAPGN